VAEAFVCDATRTPIGRYGGALAAVRADDLCAVPIRALMARNPGVDWQALDEVLMGCVNQSGEDNRNVARMASLLAGLPESVPGITVNRLCASGLEAVATGARMIRTGEAQIVIAGGVEGMSRSPYVMGKASIPFGRDQQMYDSTIGWRFVNPLMKRLYGTDSMPDTAENVAAAHGISRHDQDAFALRSQQRTHAARQAGVFDQEITAVAVPQKRGDPLMVNRDEHPRETSLEALARLPAPFRVGGTVTAGNSSGINDGACALLLASESAAQRFGLKPIARVLGAAAAGVAPRVMGMGPVPATRKLLALLGMQLSQFDLVELNEAFAAQALAVLRELGLPDDAGHVNPNGGAIALGHPLGASGARLVTAAAYQMMRSGARNALCTLCVGVGQGSALALQRV
jgi:3-oxoadipyl-CoA thiolase